MNLKVLGQSRAGARKSLMKEQRVLVHKAEGNELGEASGFLLDLSQQKHLTNPVRGSFSVPIHHGRGGADAAAMCSADHLDPLRGGKFVGGEDVSNFVVENFGCCARESAQSVIAQHRKIVGQRHAGEFHAVDNLHGREGMDVHARHSILYRAQNVAVVKRRQSVRQAALDADFGGAESPGFNGFLRDLIEAQEIGVGFARAAAEGAELASYEADIGEVYVAVDDIGDEVAGEFGAQKVCGYQQAEKIVAIGVGQGEAFFERKRGTVLSLENFFQVRARHRRQAWGDV